MNKILIFTATYNEVSNIDILLDRINSYCQNVDILIVDDNSSDGTINVLKKFEKECKNINLIIREKKLGLNTAHKIGYNYVGSGCLFFNYGSLKKYNPSGNQRFCCNAF